MDTQQASSRKTFMNLGLIVCLLFCLSGFLFNFGWLRSISVYLILPFLLIHIWVHRKIIQKSLRIKKRTVSISLLSHATLISAFVLFPDSYNVVPTYSVFGLYSNPPDAFYSIAWYSFLASLALSVYSVMNAWRSNQYEKLKKRNSSY